MDLSGGSINLSASGGDQYFWSDSTLTVIIFLIHQQSI